MFQTCHLFLCFRCVLEAQAIIVFQDLSLESLVPGFRSLLNSIFHILSSAMILLLCWYAVSIIKSPECRGFSVRVSFTFNKRGKWRHAVSNEKVSSTKNSKIYLRQPRIEVENLNLLWITEKGKEQLDNWRREVGNTVKKEKSPRPSFFLDNFVSSTKLIVNWPLWRVSKPDIPRVSPSSEQMMFFPNFNRFTWQIITHSKEDDSDSLQQT